MKLDHLELGTLSFARCHGEMSLEPRERVRLILAAVQAYCPTFLITAGHAVHTRAQLKVLAEGHAELGLPCTIITEVLHDGERPSARQTHAMYAIQPDGTVHKFGRQQFGTTKELDDDAGGGRIARLESALRDRFWSCDDWNIFALICGELNVIQGRRNPQFRSAAVGDAIYEADIVINPTHDRMSNAGTIDVKRRLLSLASPDRRNRVYVSCSNWEECGNDKGRRQHITRTLHTVYVGGTAIQPDALPTPVDSAFGFHYRHWTLDL